MFGYLLRLDKPMKTIVEEKVEGKRNRKTKENFLRPDKIESRCHIVQGGNNTSRRPISLVTPPTRAMLINTHDDEDWILSGRG